MSNAYYMLFPELPEMKWKEVNLNDEFLRSSANNSDDNPMRDIRNQCSFLNFLSDDEFRTYGGFGENRIQLWRGFERNAVKMTHLGVDLNNLPAGTTVISLWYGTIHHIMRDRTVFNGWGGRVILKLRNGIVHNGVTFNYVMFGHLKPDVLPAVGTEIQPGDRIGFIGDPSENGGWFPHLHLQVMSQAFIDLHPNLDNLDGYDFTRDIEELGRFVCDPILLW